jgi:1,4-alpha-glucan branching enzyme
VLSFLRKGSRPEDTVLVVGNFTPVTRTGYQVGAPAGGRWQELLNSDATGYGGSSQGNLGQVEAAAVPFHGRPYSLELTLPPLGIAFFRQEKS